MITTVRILRVSEDVVPVGQFKAQAKKWLARASQTGQPVVITQTVKIVLTLLCMASFAHAADSPPKPDEMDEFCEDAGRSKDPSISPKDRLRFGEACVCIDDVGCGVPGSPRFLARVEVERRALELLRLAEVERQAAQAKIQAERRVEALKEARLACIQLADCFHRNTASPQECDESESRFEYECSANLRDSLACGQAMKAAAQTHEAAECQAALQK